MNEKLVRQRLKKTIFKNLTSIANVLSVTFVGSFAESKDLSGISDIDTVVICDHLTEDVFNSCMAAADFVKQGEYDGIVSIGGGSVMDTAKAANLLSCHGGEILDYVNAPIAVSYTHLTLPTILLV